MKKSFLPLQRNCIMATVPFWQISDGGYCTALPSVTKNFSMAWHLATDFGIFFNFGLYEMSKVFNLDKLDNLSGKSFKLLCERFNVWSICRLPMDSGIFLSLLLFKWSTWNKKIFVIEYECLQKGFKENKSLSMLSKYFWIWWNVVLISLLNFRKMSYFLS